jgi:hypothetical protein
MRCSMCLVSGSDDEPLDPRPVAGLSGSCPVKCRFPPMLSGDRSAPTE